MSVTGRVFGPPSTPEEDTEFVRLANVTWALYGRRDMPWTLEQIWNHSVGAKAFLVKRMLESARS